MEPAVRTAEKYLLTLAEAAEYFNIGTKRLVSLLDTPEGADLRIRVGVKRLVNRKKMEKYLDNIYSL